MWVVDPVTGCWVWQRATNGKAGYGIVRRNGKTITAHRFVYEMRCGPVDPHLVLDHVKERCSTTLCVNPDHLQVVTHAENTRRGRRGKLTAEQVLSVRESTERASVLAKRLGVSKSHVNMIRAGTRGKVEACDTL